MPEVAESFYAALKARLVGDAGLSSWATTHFGKAITFRDGGDSGPVGDDGYPAIFLELEEAGQEEIILGGDLIRVTATILGAVIWLEENGANVLAQRLQLHDLLRKALIADPGFGNTVNLARLTGVDREDTQKPLVAVSFAVRAEYDLEAA